MNVNLHSLGNCLLLRNECKSPQFR